MAVKITGARASTPAQKLNLSGTTLLSVDGHQINDMLDYEFYTQGAKLELAVMKAGALAYISVDKDEYEPLGCDFEHYLIDDKHSCSNHCMFCFIDQLPPGLAQKALYFKDDDERLSFLFGNYITLTNLSDHEVERIKMMHISPINISVHTVDPALRIRMMANKRAGEVLKYIDEFAAENITMNCQVVACRGINDGDKLRETVEKLASLYPAVQSIAVVPCDLTKYREKLYPLTSYDKESAAAVLDILMPYSESYYKEHGTHIVYPGDEWFLTAGRPLPSYDFYDDFCQIENGVGMWRRLHDEFLDALKTPRRRFFLRRFDVVTGTLAYPLIKMLMEMLQGIYPQVHITVHAVKNNFFGGDVSCAGLLTGTDIIAQLKGKCKSRILYLPEACLREEKDMFIDSTTVKDVEKALRVKVRVLPTAGDAVVSALLK